MKLETWDDVIRARNQILDSNMTDEEKEAELAKLPAGLIDLAEFWKKEFGWG